MRLVIDKNSIELLDHEYLEYHDGREGYPFSLDCSIMGIKTEERAKELKTLLTASYFFTKYPMEEILVHRINGSVEVLFAIGDFHPIIAS